VEPTSPRLRVALAASPPLLADSLRELIAAAGRAVSVSLEPTREHFDVAILTPGSPPVDADAIIELDDAAREGGFAVLRRGGEVTALPDLGAVIATVLELPAGR
jgi:hypothetical protein